MRAPRSVRPFSRSARSASGTVIPGGGTGRTFSARLSEGPSARTPAQAASAAAAPRERSEARRQGWRDMSILPEAIVFLLLLQCVLSLLRQMPALLPELHAAFVASYLRHAVFAGSSG